MLEGLRANPGQVPLRPLRAATPEPTLPQQKFIESLAGDALVPLEIIARPCQVAHGFHVRLGDRHLGKFPGAKQGSQTHCVAAIRLDVATLLHGNQRRRDNSAIDAFGFQVAGKFKAGGPRFVADAQGGRVRDPFEPLQQLGEIVRQCIDEGRRRIALPR